MGVLEGVSNFLVSFIILEQIMREVIYTLNDQFFTPLLTMTNITGKQSSSETAKQRMALKNKEKIVKSSLKNPPITGKKRRAAKLLENQARKSFNRQPRGKVKVLCCVSNN